MAELQGRKVFKVFNQDFIVDERYIVTKELGQGAYGIVWYDIAGTLIAFDETYLSRETVRQQTMLRGIASLSRRLPTSSARKFSQNELYERSSSYSTLEVIEMFVIINIKAYHTRQADELLR